MTPEQEHFSRTLFKLRIHEADGQSYQDLFSAVMSKRYPGFRPVKPQGRKGDKGNDGYIPERGAYFQVFAPEKPTASVAEAVRKAQRDFQKLLTGWSSIEPIQEYWFAFNDKFFGTNHDIDEALKTIKSTHSLRIAGPFLAKDLMLEFVALDEADRNEILGGIIPRAQFLHDIEFQELTPILQHIVDTRVSPSLAATRQAPDLDEKIRFNGLSKPVGQLLGIGTYQAGVIEEYFRRHGNFSRKDIRDRLSGLYVETAEEIQQLGGDADETFFRLWDRVSPGSEAAVREAALALLAFYFESCDLFLHPTSL